MLNRNKTITFLALILLVTQGLCLSEEEKGWVPYYFGPATSGGLVSENDEGIILSLDKAGAFGAYNPSKFGGNFDAQTEIKTGKGICGMMLFKDNGGRPDPSNFVGIERREDEDGNKTVRVFAIKDGQDFTQQGAQWNPRFEAVLNNESFGFEAKAFRILEDEKAKCLHFYYKYERKIDGEKREGWLEFSTLPDWDGKPFYFYPYVKSNGDFTSKAVFMKPMVMLTPSDDRSDKDTGFKATRRDYTFSGFSGDAVVVTFDREFPFYDKAKFVFWSEAEYIPWWHIDDKCAAYYEFCEIWGGATEGCDEPMGDRLLRWTKADIVESNKARVIVHWRYVLADPEYKWWSMDPVEKPYADEWYCFYPDGTGVRKVTYTPVTTSKYETDWNEISELTVIKRGGVKPSEIIDKKAVSIFNLDGKKVDYLWDLSKKRTPAKRDDETRNWPEAICRVNLKDRPAVFEVFAQGEEAYKKTFPEPFKNWWGHYGEDWAFEMRGQKEYEGDFGVFSHWPISKMPYEEPDKTFGRYLREPGHISLLPIAGHPKVKGPTTWAMLVGMSKPWDDQDARDRTSSWLYPGDISMIDENAKFIGNDYYQRALVFETDKLNRACQFTMYPKIISSVVVNPVFIIKNWGNNPVSVTMNGKPLKEGLDYRCAIEGDSAVIWVKAKFSGQTAFLIK
ncbi:MAG: hypothetical protein PHX64_03115 [Candidatus Omnitrophica bacterium]|nr:hypothetical protein [Candidatus Omnitrophota bacterium]MDD5310721.1 hypothetical protein [Candidatus Omnitrophota bacterium]MDD5545595.1 hypothetical protein [Candidatus Omnitrophota bacterium]